MLKLSCTYVQFSTVHRTLIYCLPFLLHVHLSFSFSTFLSCLSHQHKIKQICKHALILTSTFFLIHSLIRIIFYVSIHLFIQDGKSAIDKAKVEVVRTLLVSAKIAVEVRTSWLRSTVHSSSEKFYFRIFWSSVYLHASCLSSSSSTFFNSLYKMFSPLCRIIYHSTYYEFSPIFDFFHVSALNETYDVK